MFTLLVGFLIGAAVMWLARIAALRDARQEWERSKLQEANDRIRALETAAREVVKFADEQPWDPALNAFWHAVDRLVEELEREQ